MSVRRLSLQEWFVAHQLAHIARHHFHLDAVIEVDLRRLQAVWGRQPPLSYVLVKALALTLRHVPAANRQYFPGWFGPRMLVSERCSINLPVMLHFDGEDYLSVTTVRDADRKSVAEIRDEVRAYRRTPLEQLPIGRLIVGRSNRWWRRWRLAVIHALVNAVPGPMESRGVGLASVSSLLNADPAGTCMTLNGRGPGAISLTACHFDAASGRARIALSFDHFALSGMQIAQAGIALSRILQGELEAGALDA